METQGKSRLAMKRDSLRVPVLRGSCRQSSSKLSCIRGGWGKGPPLKGIKYKKFKNQNRDQNRFPLKFSCSPDWKLTAPMLLARYGPRTLQDRNKPAHIGVGNSFLIIKLDAIIHVLYSPFPFLLHLSSEVCVLPQVLGQNG